MLFREQLDALPEDAEDLSFGNSVYKIRFDDRKERPLFGHRYWFYLKDAVDDVPEYIVHWDHLVQYALFPRTKYASSLTSCFRMATEYDLYPTYMKEFHEVFSENQEHAEFGPLLQRMKVVDANGESQMDEDQWEAASKSPHPSSFKSFIIAPISVFPPFPHFSSSYPRVFYSSCSSHPIVLLFEMLISAIAVIPSFLLAAVTAGWSSPHSSLLHCGLNN